MSPERSFYHFVRFRIPVTKKKVLIARICFKIILKILQYFRKYLLCLKLAEISHTVWSIPAHCFWICCNSQTVQTLELSHKQQQFKGCCGTDVCRERLLFPATARKPWGSYCIPQRWGGIWKYFRLPCNSLCVYLEEQTMWRTKHKGLSIIRAHAHNSQDLATLPLVSAVFPGEGIES